MQYVPVVRSDARFLPDPKRVISKPFRPGGEVSPDGRSRTDRILSRILALPEDAVTSTLAATTDQFSARHRDLSRLLDDSFASVSRHLEDPGSLSSDRQRLIGAYFTHEYSIDAAALSNPSMVPAPTQEGAAPGAVRFVMSLRAIGEGHISSIEFRSGVVDAGGRVVVDEPCPFVTTARRRSPVYDKVVFRAKLAELHSENAVVSRVLDSLPDRFTIEQLETILHEVEQSSAGEATALAATHTIHWLAASNYESAFEPDSAVSTRVLFPAGPTESHGMEDARFVRFQYDEGRVTYFAPYTAFDGHQILPQLIETEDFVSFRVATLNGPAAANKGIALFPRKVGGRFMALARLDNENNHIIRSDNVRFWHERERFQVPVAPWELIQIGNCGSPLETEAGWLVLTHGVGPFRQYAIGAVLLDLEDPCRVIGHLREPLLSPANDERDGYVPNVVYSCGSMIAGSRLVVPYGFSDVGARIATLALDDLLSALTKR